MTSPGPRTQPPSAQPPSTGTTAAPNAAQDHQVTQDHRVTQDIQAALEALDPGAADHTGSPVTPTTVLETAPAMNADAVQTEDAPAAGPVATEPVAGVPDEPVIVTSMAQLLGEAPASKSTPPEAQGNPDPNRKSQNAQGQKRPNTPSSRGPRSGPAPLSTARDTPFSAQGRICVTANIPQQGEARPSGERPASERLIGISISDGENTMFAGVPGGASRNESFDEAFHWAVSLAPTMRQLELITPHEQLWTRAAWRPDTRELVRRKALDIRPRRPQDLHGHPGELAALLASRGQTGPRLINYHLYSAALADAEGRVFVGALLYGQGTLRMYSAMVEDADAARLDVAELHAALWAFSHVEDHSALQMVQSSAGLRPLWEGPSAGSLDDALRRAARPLRNDIERRSVHLRQNAEPAQQLLVRAARELAGRLAITGRHPAGMLATTVSRGAQAQAQAARQAGAKR